MIAGFLSSAFTLGLGLVSDKVLGFSAIFGGSGLVTGTALGYFTGTALGLATGTALG